MKLQQTKDPDSMQRLRKAVEDWDNKSGPLFNHLSESGMALPMKDYAASFTVHTFLHSYTQHSPHGSATVISKYFAWYLVSV